MSRIPNLNGFVYFEAVARRGTISRAAEELSVSSSAISQQIKLLEQSLGVKLFRRQGRLLSLTLEGEQIFQTSATALRMLSDAQHHFGKTREPYRLNMRVAPSFGVRWLGPRLSDFVDRHPDWDLRVDAAPDPTDFDREVMELDIRYGQSDWPGYFCQTVFYDRVLPLCSPAYRAALPNLASPDEILSNARLIGTPRSLCQWDHWLGYQQIDMTTPHLPILMDRSTMALQLAVDGVGVVLDSLSLAYSDVAEGRLVPLFPDLPVLRVPSYSAICPTRYHKRRAVQLFLDWMVAQVSAHDDDIAALYLRDGLHEVPLDFETLFPEKGG